MIDPILGVCLLVESVGRLDRHSFRCRTFVDEMLDRKIYRRGFAELGSIH